jgi:DNA (cytosine-5)-methyltransferase 1
MRPTTAPRFTYAEVCAGIGGFRVALDALGGRCVFASEYCRHAQRTYRSNWPDDVRSLLVGDIRRIHPAQIPYHDVLVAGFPCQDLSNAGRRAGLDGERSGLFYELVRLLAVCRPQALLFENVRGLLTLPGALDELKAALSAVGYSVRVRLLDAAHVVPQRRRRVFVVGFRDAAVAERFIWLRLPRLRRHAEDELDDSAAASLTLPDAKWAHVRASAYFGRFPGARLLGPGALAQTLQATYKSGCLLYSQFVPQPGANPRFFSTREGARLMGLPESHLLDADEGHAYRQLGNAVAPPVVAVVAAALLAALEQPAARPAAWCAGAQCEAVALALQLAAAASRRPLLRCWLTPPLLRALGLGREGDDDSDDSTECDHDDGAEQHAVPGVETATAAGSAVHGPVGRQTEVALAVVVERARDGAERRRADALSAGCSSPRHAQTLPAPTTAIKEDIWRRVKPFRCARLGRGD